jgi:hypothetical protein
MSKSEIIEYSGEYFLKVDREIIEDITVEKFAEKSFGIINDINDKQKINKFLNTLSKADLPDSIAFIDILNDEFEGHQLSIYLDLEDNTCKLVITIVIENWDYPPSFNYYFKLLSELLDRKAQSVSKAKDEVLEGCVALEIEFVSERNDTTVLKEFWRFREILIQTHEEVIRNFIEQEKIGNIYTIFKFPEEFKVSCEQYLLYFAQFLRDLGINATSNLQEEGAGKVLFAVTPTDDIEALDKIREALAVYLNLPSSPVLYNDSFQSMQLKQQIENLQHSQRMKEMEMRSAQYALGLAQQNIENQDKIITRQNSFIDNQNKIIEKITSKSIMIDSLENKEELEKFCEGFELGKSEFLIKHFGLHLNPATVLKNVGKKILGKEEERISILDSDEETDKK